MYTPLTPKQILKYDKELVELHKRVLTTYLVQIGVKARTRKKIFKLYDVYLDESNIREYFHRESSIFINALVTDRLEEIRDYFKSSKSKKRKRNVH